VDDDAARYAESNYSWPKPSQTACICRTLEQPVQQEALPVLADVRSRVRRSRAAVNRKP
jgi:hypothetical protein